MPPTIDFLTLLVVVAANLLAISAALPLIMGRALSAAARNIQGYMLLQALAWLLLIASTRVAGTLADRVLSTVSIACGSAATLVLFRSLSGWLGPRRGYLAMWLLTLAAPAGYFIGFGNYAFRVGWSNVIMASGLLVVAYACTRPVHAGSRGWRWLLCTCLVVMATLMLGRGYLGALTTAYPSFRTPHPVNLAFAIAANVTLVLSVISLLVAWRDEAEGRLRTLAMTDGLTGLLNRRSFMSQGERLLAHATRHGHPITALMLDVDHFKQVNDTRGHEAGDRALQLLARLLSETSRSGDLIGRLGGEEFGVLLIHNSASAGIAFDQRLRRRLHAASVAELGFALDYSTGLATPTPGETDLAALMARADRALYEAKAAGRGRLVAAS